MEKENICLDSCFIIDLLNGDEGTSMFLEVNKSSSLSTTDISVYETALGIMRSKKGNPKKLFDVFVDLLSQLIILPASGQFALDAARTNALFYKKGTPIGDNDCLIAAIMKKNGINRIVTRNVKHFEKIPGIKVLKY